MTISTTIVKNSYSGNGSTAVFNYTFKILDNADLSVIIRSSTGTETIKTLNTHYTITGALNPSGGSITFTAGNIPTAGQTIVLLRNTNQVQNIDYVENDPFPAETHELGLDRAVILIQELQEEVDRSLKISRTNTIGTTEFTTGSNDRSGKILGFDSNGDLSVYLPDFGSFRGNWTTATVYSTKDIVKDTSNGNIYYVTVAHTSTGSQPLSSNANVAKYSLLIDAAAATTSATNASTSATNAATSATNAAASASSASGYLATVATSATNASTSATNAGNSATSASTSASNASTSASSASSSASSALTSSNNAASSASTAATSATTATTKASEASTSATNAASSASSASTSASTATTKASEASTSATNAATSATTATTQATTATTQATNASNSATSASSSASTATTQANAASTSATNAATSATNASGSASSASASATAASAAQTAVETLFDNFDDRFLGTKTSNPSVDNDGNTLSVGAVYYNSVSQQVRFWNGSSWDAPSASAATSATNASNSASAASSSASSAASSASIATTAASNAADSYDSFDDRYLGAKSSAPSLDNDGNSLLTGAIYWNSTANQLYIWTGSGWNAAAFSASGAVTSFNSRSGAVTLSSNDVTSAIGFTPISSSSTDTLTNKSISGSTNTITNLSASNLSSGTVPSARLSLTSTDIPSLDASKITTGTIASARLSLIATDIPSLDASKITTGTIASARLSLTSSDLPTVPTTKGGTGLTTIGTSNQYLKVNSGATGLEYGTVDLTSLSASNLTSGTVPSARLSLTSSDLPTVPTTKGGTGLTTIGTANQYLKVNSGATALEYGTVDLTSLSASNLTSGTIPAARYSTTDVVTPTATQTLTNKTLTTPVISSITNTGTITLPTSTDTLVGRATTDTLTNKSISGSANTLTNIPNAALTNSSITINGSSVSLGGTATIASAVFSETVFSTPTSGQTTFTTAYTVGYIQVFVNGIKLLSGTDFTATNGTSVVLTEGVSTTDVVEIIKFK
jgi:hypothetical protein